MIAVKDVIYAFFIEAISIISLGMVHKVPDVYSNIHRHMHVNIHV